MDGSFTSIQFEVYEYKYPSIQIDHIFLEVSSMNKICVPVHLSYITVPLIVPNRFSSIAALHFGQFIQDLCFPNLVGRTETCHRG